MKTKSYTKTPPPDFHPMTVRKLKVVRKSDFGAFLDAGTGNSTDDILLHVTQQTSVVKVGDTIEVFLYLDPKKRLTASMRVPKMKVGQIARLKIINLTSDGAFLEVGAERGIFMPFAEMLGRPQIGDVVWAKLYTDEKTGRLALTMNVSEELQRASKRATNVKIGDELSGAVYEFNDDGAYIFTDERFIVFVAQEKIPRALKVGEVLDVEITAIRKDGKLEGSLENLPLKEISADAEKILQHIRENGGVMDFNDKTEPEKIYETFQISKAAFKRAIGHLFKARLIEKIDGGFKLT